MTDRLDLAAIEARCNAATKGPWRPEAITGWNGSLGVACVVGPTKKTLHIGGGSFTDLVEPDAAFIAAARTDVPLLLARVKELEQRYARLLGFVKEWQEGRKESYLTESLGTHSLKHVKAAKALAAYTEDV